MPRPRYVPDPPYREPPRLSHELLVLDTTLSELLWTWRTPAVQMRPDLNDAHQARVDAVRELWPGLANSLDSLAGQHTGLVGAVYDWYNTTSG